MPYATSVASDQPANANSSSEYTEYTEAEAYQELWFSDISFGPFLARRGSNDSTTEDYFFAE
ncbi:hypothetical protein DPMN_142498 [Dreissena polymorpha]|uniref:Uncharacterized protein n=1 Tax=Dreissena polymorpha TaxID=45954 RepID=A0A9D4GB91_DREPO|nr:hypothetical protein DPMN_142498 [Dreissena polymorpha]